MAVVAAATAVACLVAAAAEGWRFSLMLAGRTNVLPGGPVHDSDVLVVAASVTSLVLGLVTALAAVPLLVSLHRAAAQRAGRAPSRSAAGVVARLMVPGWNLYGAGQVLMEIVGTLAESDHRRRSSRITAPLWWLAWVANGLLVVATLIMAFGRRLQIVADTVQMHIAVDLVAAVVAGMFAAVIASVSRAWAGRGAGQYGGWSVRQPESTARNRINRMAAPPSTEAAPATVAAQEDRAGVRGGRAEVSASGDEVSASGDDVPAGADELPAISDRTPAGGGGAPADARSGDEEPSNAADLELSEAPSPGSADPDVDPR